MRLSLAAPLQLVAQRNERSSEELSRFLSKQVRLATIAAAAAATAKGRGEEVVDME